MDARIRIRIGASWEEHGSGDVGQLAVHRASSPALREIERTADLLGRTLVLRPVAPELARLAWIADRLAADPDARLLLWADAPAALVRLLEAADHARSVLHAERPSATASTLALARAQEQRADELPLLRRAAAAGDALRSPELTVLAPTSSGHADDERALALAGLHIDGSEGGPCEPRVRCTPAGADVHLPLPAGEPTDLRAVHTAAGTSLQGSGVARLLQAPASLGPLVPGAVAAHDGQLVASFVRPEGR